MNDQPSDDAVQIPVTVPEDVATPEVVPETPVVEPEVPAKVPEETAEPNEPVEDEEPAVPTVPVIPENPEQVASVPGAVETPVATGEQTAVLPEQAPNPVQGTAAPSQDAVTVNQSWDKVVTDLQSVVGFVNRDLSFHTLSAEVVTDIEAVVEKVTKRL